jgi:amino acid permease
MKFNSKQNLFKKFNPVASKVFAKALFVIATLKVLFLIAIFAVLILTTACSSHTISEIKNESYVGKTVTVTGKVDSSMKIGKISGYSLKDDTGKISVSSQNLPKEGETVTASGVLMKDIILGYYILED